MIGFYFFKLLLRTIFENKENFILVFSQNCSCFFNLMFYVFSKFLRK